MTTAHQGHPAGYACGAGHGCSLLACQPAEAAMLALMPRPCKCNRRLDQGKDDISGGSAPGGCAGAGVVAEGREWRPEVLIQPETKAIGKTLADSGLLDAQGAKLLAVRRRDGTLHVNPSADLRLAEGDLIIALGSEQQLLTTASMLN